MPERRSDKQDERAVSRQEPSKRESRKRPLVPPMAFHSLILAAGLFGSAAGAAEDYRARDVGGWTVAASEDGNGCFLTRQYDGVGGTTLLLGLDTDGTNHLSVLNDNWSIKRQERLNLDFRLSNGGYTGYTAIGMISNGKKRVRHGLRSEIPLLFRDIQGASHIPRQCAGRAAEPRGQRPCRRGTAALCRGASGERPSQRREEEAIRYRTEGSVRTGRGRAR